MKRRSFVMIMGMGLVLGRSVQAAPLPPDVRPNHWATASVESVLKNGILSLEGQSFRGEAKVTRTQAIIAIAKLARAVEMGQWKMGKRQVISARTVEKAQKGNWKDQPLTRYTFFHTLARFGDYLTAGLRRPGPNSKDLGKSEVLTAPKITLPPNHPAYASLTYLAGNRMVGNDSLLLTPDDKPVHAIEVSRALAQVATGLNDRFTEMGKEADGSTPDATSRRRKTQHPPH